MSLPDLKIVAIIKNVKIIIITSQLQRLIVISADQHLYFDNILKQNNLYQLSIILNMFKAFIYPG